MKANFQSMPGREQPQHELDEHLGWLTEDRDFMMPGTVGGPHTPPEGYEEYHVVDVLGDELVWMNNSFPKDKFTWYLWFESVFLVPAEMASFCSLRWPQRDPNDPFIFFAKK